MVAGFISERWPASNRNPGRLHVGTPGRIKSESAPPDPDKDAKDRAQGALRYATDVIAALRTLSNDEEVLKALQEELELRTPQKFNRVEVNTGDFEWYTPDKYVTLARTVLGGFDLDPASNDFAQQTVKAAQYFTIETDGLKHEWRGRVWLNPPYVQPLVSDFINKLITEHSSGHVTSAILLVNNCTDATWFHSAAEACAAVCFTRGRIKFEKPDGIAGAPTQGQAFFYFGADVERFSNVFDKIGLVTIPRRRLYTMALIVPSSAGGSCVDRRLRPDRRLR